MNISAANVTIVIEYRDTLAKAVTKNVVVVVLSISLNCINAGLVQTFRKHQIFYTNPRYILFIHLVLNDMIQVMLTVILFIISYILHKIKVYICCLFILLALIVTENTPLNLACMAVECYIAICMPLRHVQMCTIRRTRVLIGLIWIASLLSVFPDLIGALATEQLSFFNTRVFCLRESAFRNPHTIKKRDVTYIIYLVIVWLVIFYTYFRILFTAKTASKDAKKARNTIVLHGFQLLLCMTTYADPLLKKALLYLFPKNFSDILFACYIIIQILPRSISPIIYGIRDKTFRKSVFVFREMNVSSANVTVFVRTRDSFTEAVTKNVIVIVFGIFINYINACLFHTFRKHQIFNMNPRFIFFIHLVVNDIIQLLTSITLFILTYTLYYIQVPICCLLIVPAVIATQNTPLNLTFMAAECYIAVCLPLHHSQICTIKKTYIAIGLIWTISSFSILPDVFIFLATESLEFMESKIFCKRDSMFRSMYSIKKRDASHILFMVIVWLTLVYTYFRILFVAKAADTEARKARNTILIHVFQVLYNHNIFNIHFTPNPPSLYKSGCVWIARQDVQEVLQKIFIKRTFNATSGDSVKFLLMSHCHTDLQDHQINSMNSSTPISNVSSSASYGDSFGTAVAKNVIVVAFGLTIYYINGTLIHTFRKHEIFYFNPRYILFIHLVVNDIIQLSTTVILFVSSYVFYRINASLCCIIITLALFTTLNTPLNLAVMSVECYISVCLPLRHPQLCTVKRTYFLIGGIWVLSSLSALSDLFAFVATEPAHIFYSTVFCVKDHLFRHPVHMKKKEVYTVFLIGIWLVLLYSYVMIFRAAKSADGDAKKARNTVLLHAFQLLLAMLTFVAYAVKEGLMRWFPKYFTTVVFVPYIIIQILPRLISPIVYGLRDKMFRQHFEKYILCTLTHESLKHGQKFLSRHPERPPEHSYHQKPDHCEPLHHHQLCQRHPEDEDKCNAKHSHLPANITAKVPASKFQDVLLESRGKLFCTASNIVVQHMRKSSLDRHFLTAKHVLNMNPRYILYIHLVINDIILLTLFTLLHVLSYIFFSLHVPLCIILVTIAMFSTQNSPLTLACMALETYIAICFPLHHSQICTVRKTWIVISLIWMFSMFSVLPDLFVTVATEPLDFFHSRVFCVIANVFRYPTLTEERNISNGVSLVVVWLTLVYTYFRILFAAKAAAADARKARNTVLLHGFQLLLYMLIYVFQPIMEGLMYLFPNGVLIIRFVLSILIQVLSRLLSPVIYGLRDTMFRNCLKRDLYSMTGTMAEIQKL
ncbi:hypothetical protein F2P81_012492 [Xyrichtys novacula]|uniref:G-protein coupled receptors family 1 profile domain-containing protein n=1 Tax=Xyrichtys novacula TaxID=13765 RepID=A0AAV1EQY5_XYRNO|nr:hypothetical protein F2P81_012492 [Xyrichtys novacula]